MYFLNVKLITEDMIPMGQQNTQPETQPLPGLDWFFSGEEQASAFLAGSLHGGGAGELTLP